MANKSAILLSHHLERQGADAVSVQLHEISGTLHVLVNQGPSAMRFQFEEQSTEYIADYYTSFVKTLQSTGYTLTRVQTADAAPVLVGKKTDTSLELLSRYFHLPINDASKVLRICSTSLKKICRRHGLQRWPHRKVKSVDQRVAKALIITNTADGSA